MRHNLNQRPRRQKVNFLEVRLSSQFLVVNHYGDVILLLDENGNAIHSAIYIADDLVFTKNGINFAQPWKLEHLKTLTARYELDFPDHVVFLRRKNS